MLGPVLTLIAPWTSIEEGLQEGEMAPGWLETYAGSPQIKVKKSAIKDEW